jgi:glycosyltransferase involved in cell wall biosynthesis
MTENLKILLIGIDYFSRRCSSDKNFWHRMLPLLAVNLGNIAVISFNYRNIARELQPAPGTEIEIFNVRPSHLGFDLRPDPSSVHNPEKCHSHFKSPPKSPVEYWLSFLRIRPLVRQLVTERGITNIHCMDNFGPAMRRMRHWFSPVPLSVSAMGYYARGPLHDQYLQLCYRGLDAIVPFSAAFAQKLLELGLSGQRLHVIPWGIDVESVRGIPTANARAEAKRRLGIDPDHRLVLWTGFIQQIKEPEFHTSMRIAQKTVQHRDDVCFVFAFKPESYRPDYQSFTADRIRVLATTNESFEHLLQAADYLLSPVTNIRSIVTPPLTWLEAMATGIPVITNRVPGAEAAIESEKSGFVAETVDSIVPLLDAALSKTDLGIRAQARSHVLQHYSIARSSIGYQELWAELNNRSR